MRIAAQLVTIIYMLVTVRIDCEMLNQEHDKVFRDLFRLFFFLGSTILKNRKQFRSIFNGELITSSAIPFSLLSCRFFGVFKTSFGIAVEVETNRDALWSIF